MLACPCPRLFSIPCVKLSNEVLYDILPQGASELSEFSVKSLLLLSKVESLNLQVVAVLMPLEIKRHTVPHLKGLNSGLEP